MRGKRRKRGKGTAGLSGELGLKELQHLSRSHSCWSIPFSAEGGREKTSPIHTLPELLLKVASMANRRGTTEFLDCQGEATLAFCCLEKWANKEIFWWSKLHFSHGLHLLQQNLVQFQFTSGLLARMGICLLHLSTKNV